MSYRLQIAILILIFLSFNVMFVEDVVAPPTGDSLYSGIIKSTGSDIKIIHADINMTVGIEYRIFERLICNIELQGRFNLTNTAGLNSTILLLYSPSWGSPKIPLNQTNFTCSIYGSPLIYENHSLSNITHPRQLLPEFHERFPDWVWVHDEIWQHPANFTLVNLTLGPKESVLFTFADSIIVTFYEADYYVIGYGFGKSQLLGDLTAINTRITLVDGSQFVGVSFYPDDSVVSTQDGYEYTGIWNIKPSYSSSFLYGISTEPIRAGFSVYLKNYENYYPPQPTNQHNSTSISTTTSNSASNSTPDYTLDCTNLAFIITSLIIMGFIIISYYKLKS
jgi:hypothetical protein